MTEIQIKEQIESWLTINKIVTVKIYYRGSGDEGCVEDVYFYNKDHVSGTLPPLVTDYQTNNNGNYYFPHYDNLLEIVRISLHSFVAGWELNEGSSGWWTWDVSTGIIRIEHERSVYRTEYEEHATAWNVIKIPDWMKENG